MSFAPVLMHGHWRLLIKFVATIAPCLRRFYKQKYFWCGGKNDWGEFWLLLTFSPKTFNHQRQTNKQTKKQQQQTNKQNNEHRLNEYFTLWGCLRILVVSHLPDAPNKNL